MNQRRANSAASGRHSVAQLVENLRAEGLGLECYLHNIRDTRLRGQTEDSVIADLPYLRGAVVDSREADEKLLFVARKGELQDGHDYIAAAYLQGCRNFLVGQDWMAKLSGESELAKMLTADACVIAVEGSTEEALFAWARTYRRSLSQLFVLALGGSYGKTSTKELLGWMLAQRYRCHITEGNRNALVGCALTILGIAPETEVAVLELGIDHPGEMEQLCAMAQPNAALLTGIGSAHLGNFASRTELAQQKGQIYSQLRPSGWKPAIGNLPPLALLPAGDDYLAVLRQELGEGSFEILYSDELARQKGYQVEDLGLKGLCFHFVNEGLKLHCLLPLLGLHTAQVFWAAAAASESLGLSPSEIFAGAAHYQPLFGRGELLEKSLAPESSLQTAGKPLPITLLQDCYNASPESLYALIQMLGSWYQDGLLPPCVLVLADMLELGTASAQCHEKVADLLRALKHRETDYVDGKNNNATHLKILLYGLEMGYTWAKLRGFDLEEGLHTTAEKGFEDWTGNSSGQAVSCQYLSTEAELTQAMAWQLCRVAETSDRTQRPLLVLKGSRAMGLEKIAQKILL